MVGASGFRSLVMFAMESDFAILTTRLCRVQEVADADIASARGEIVVAMRELQALFGDSRLFQAEPNETNTWQLINSLRTAQDVIFGKLGRLRGNIEWSKDIPELQSLVHYGHELFALCKDFLELTSRTMTGDVVVQLSTSPSKGRMTMRGQTCFAHWQRKRVWMCRLHVFSSSRHCGMRDLYINGSGTCKLLGVRLLNYSQTGLGDQKTT